MVRAQVLKLHVNAGSGADRALQRVPFHFSSNENTREQQLRLEYGIEKKGQTNSSDEDKRDTKLEPNSDESGSSMLDKFENALCTSMAKLVSDLRVCAREEEQKRWCNERARYLKTIALAEREKALLKEESEKQRERTEYALNLVKAVKPLVDGMQSL